MADNSTGKILSSTEQMQANYEKYKDKFVDSQDKLINSDTFMKLLVAEMSHQDPLEPTSNTEFIAQLASFSQMGYMQNMSQFSMASYASGLVGKIASATRVEGKNVISKTGIVESVVKTADNKSYTVTIDGEKFDLSKITSVKDAPKSDSDDKTDTEAPAVDMSNALGDSISRAGMMIGMFATLSGKTTDGDNYADMGFIEAIRVNNGQISVVVNGTARPISDITELTYATVEDDKTQGTENAEETGGIEEGKA